MNREEMIRKAWAVPLVPNDRFLLLALAVLADGEGVIQADAGTLEKMTGLPGDRIAYRLRKLERWGYIEGETGPVAEVSEIYHLRIVEDCLTAGKSGRRKVHGHNPSGKRQAD